MSQSGSVSFSGSESYGNGSRDGSGSDSDTGSDEGSQSSGDGSKTFGSSTSDSSDDEAQAKPSNAPIENVQATIILPNAKVLKLTTEKPDLRVTHAMIQSHLPVRSLLDNKVIDDEKDVEELLKDRSQILQFKPDNDVQPVKIDRIALAAHNVTECTFAEMSEINYSYIAQPSVYEQIDFELNNVLEKNSKERKRIAGISLDPVFEMWDSGAKICTNLKTKSQLIGDEICFLLTKGGVRPVCDGEPCLAWHETKQRAKYIFVMVVFEKNQKILSEGSDPQLSGFAQYKYIDKWLCKEKTRKTTTYVQLPTETTNKSVEKEITVKAYFALFEKKDNSDTGSDESYDVKLKFSHKESYKCTVFNVPDSAKTKRDFEYFIPRTHDLAIDDPQVLTLSTTTRNEKANTISNKTNCSAKFLAPGFHKANPSLPISMSGQLPLARNNKYEWTTKRHDYKDLNDDDKKHEFVIEQQFLRLTNATPIPKDSTTWQIYRSLFQSPKTTKTVGKHFLDNVLNFDIIQLRAIYNNMEFYDAMVATKFDTIHNNLRVFADMLRQCFYVPNARKSRELARTLCCMLVSEMFTSKDNSDSLLTCFRQYNLGLSAYATKEGASASLKTDSTLYKLAEEREDAIFTKLYLQFNYLCKKETQDKVKEKSLQEIIELGEGDFASDVQEFFGTNVIALNRKSTKKIAPTQTLSSAEIISATQAAATAAGAALQAASEALARSNAAKSSTAEAVDRKDAQKAAATAARAALRAVEAAKKAAEDAANANDEAAVQAQSAARKAAATAAGAALHAVEIASRATEDVAKANGKAASEAAARQAKNAASEAHKALEAARKALEEVTAADNTATAVQAAVSAAQEAAKAAREAVQNAETEVGEYDKSTSKFSISWDKRVDELRRYYVVMGLQNLNAQQNG